MAFSSPPALWTHPHSVSTNIQAFRHYVNRTFSLELQTYEDLHAWSIRDMEGFARAAWVFCGIKYKSPPQGVATSLHSMWPPPAWFPGATMNYTENLLAWGVAAKPDAVAVTGLSEGSEDAEELTFVQLEREVARWASALRNLGVGPGDRVATVLTNSIGSMVVFLAAGAIGAIFSSTSVEMGAQGIVERYRQLAPKVLIYDTEAIYGGRRMDLRRKFEEVNAKLEDALQTKFSTIVKQGEPFAGRNVYKSTDILENRINNIKYEHLPFDHPIYILFSSGTTGPPKCICHGTGRALLQQKKDLMLMTDIGPNSVYYQYTTTGWMMWNYAIAGLSCGARLVLYDGNSLYPTPESQIRILETQGVTHWGTSPKFLAALRQRALPPEMNLGALQIVQTTGSPLSPELYHWFYETIPKSVALFSTSGGTDLVAAIITPSPISTIYPGEIAGASLGMKVEIWDSNRHDISTRGGEGDLVITKPFFSMPLTFWGVDGQEKYRKAYFDDFPGVWKHGDFIRRNPLTGGYEMLGRSDGVLNPGGVRFGSAELHGILDRFIIVQDCVAVGQKFLVGNDEQVLLFVKLHAGQQLSPELEASIAASIRKELSPRHVPAHILQVSDIPCTVNGKRIENVVSDIVSGRPTRLSGAVANPECLAEYAKFEVLRNNGAKANL